MHVGNWEYQVTGVERASTIVWSPFGNEEKAKGTWLIVRLTLRNTANRNFGIDTTDFELRDAGGIRYDACSSFACSSYLDQQKLARLSSFEQFPPNVDVQTALLFDIDPAAAALQLVPRQAGGAVILLSSTATASPVPAPTSSAPIAKSASAAPSIARPVASSPPPATPQALASLAVTTNIPVPWDQLAAAKSGGSDAKATSVAAVLLQTPLTYNGLALAYRIYVRSSATDATVFVLIPRYDVAAGATYPPYGRWSLLPDTARSNFFIALLNTTQASYAGLKISLYAFRYDGAPLGEGSTPPLRIGVVLPAF